MLSLLDTPHFDNLFQKFSKKLPDHFSDLTDMLIEKDLIQCVSLPVIVNLYNAAKINGDEERMGILNKAHMKADFSQYNQN